VRELDQMLTVAGGLIIAGTIGMLFSFGWSLLTSEDRYSARWAQRLFGTVIVLTALVAAFWIVFIRSGVISMDELKELLPPA
jgi:NADH:ubiquinone oxidoreductase subunit 6 (subunit J)